LKKKEKKKNAMMGHNVCDEICGGSAAALARTAVKILRTPSRREKVAIATTTTMTPTKCRSM